MNFPKDPVMLLSVVNTALRDYYSSFNALVEDNEVDGDAIIEKLKEISRNLNEGEEKRNLKALKDLGLSTYVYNVLRKAGFSTVTDIIVFPESKWRNVYHLGKKSAKELETKMRNIGYPDFTIEF